MKLLLVDRFQHLALITQIFCLVMICAFPAPVAAQGSHGTPEIGFKSPPVYKKLKPLPAVTAVALVPVVEITPPAPVVPASTVIAGCGDNSYANFIYMHESGCSLYNPNPTSGACGLGQAYPCSKLEVACPAMDYACENAYFNNYANKYGGWAGSYAFWVANSWW